MSTSYGTIPYSGVPEETTAFRTYDPDRKKKRWIITGIAMAAAVIVALIVILAVTLTQKKNEPSNEEWIKNYQEAVTVDNIMGHLEQLELIAYKFNGTRDALHGYNASADFIVDTLRANTNYEITVQVFTYENEEVIGTPLIVFENTTLIYNTDFFVMGPWGGNFNQQNVPIFAVADLGCNETDWEGIKTTDVAVVKRGICSFQQKVELGISAGARAIFIYNDGTSPDRMGPFVGSLDNTSPVPVFALSFEQGNIMVNVPKAQVDVSIQARLNLVYTRNIIADTLDGDKTKTIVVGSHLDSVAAGPGINDNGSGSSTNLELAIQLAKLQVPIKNRIRFCWWGAEELGLLGSTYYVDQLNGTEELRNIALNLNFDMVGSPNFFYGIYNGSQAALPIRPASSKISSIFTNFLNESSIPFEYTAFDGRSDYGPFLAVGIPAGGLFTGAEVVKSVEERTLFGGIANAAYDPCYHLACDTVANINVEALGVMSGAAAHSVATLALQEDLLGYLNN